MPKRRGTGAKNAQQQQRKRLRYQPEEPQNPTESRTETKAQENLAPLYR